MATLDPASYAIAQYNWEYGPQFPQPRPVHVIDAQKGPWWYYYYTQFYGPGSIQNAAWFLYGEAPPYGSTIHIYKSKQSSIPQLGSGAAKIPTAAPTAGAYTGIPSGCGPSGVAGSPY